jgi:hypothetical protein
VHLRHFALINSIVAFLLLGYNHHQHYRSSSNCNQRSHKLHLLFIRQRIDAILIQPKNPLFARVKNLTNSHTTFDTPAGCRPECCRAEADRLQQFRI